MQTENKKMMNVSGHTETCQDIAHMNQLTGYYRTLITATKKQPLCSFNPLFTFCCCCGKALTLAWELEAVLHTGTLQFSFTGPLSM